MCQQKTRSGGDIKNPSCRTDLKENYVEFARQIVLKIVDF